MSGGRRTVTRHRLPLHEMERHMDSCSASGTRLEPMGTVSYFIGFEDMRTNRKSPLHA